MYLVTSFTRERSAAQFTAPAGHAESALSQEPTRTRPWERAECAPFPSCGSGATGWDGSYKNGYVLLRQRPRFEAQQIAIWREGRRDFRVRMPGVSMVAHARRPLRTPP